MKFRLISRILGIGLIGFSFFQLLPILVSYIYQEPNVGGFVSSFAITFAVGLFFYLVNYERDYSGIRVREGFILTVSLWIFFTVFGTTPFLLSSNNEISLVSAYFESTSGLTTTGATIYSNLANEFRSMLFYRGLLQWIGGLGIIVLAIALMPLLGVGGMQLYRGEIQGPVNQSKLRPKIAETAKVLLYVYLILTLLCLFSYFFAGMSYFDAIIHSFTTVAIGGFSNYDQSFAFFDNDLIYLIACVFMFISGISFSLHYLSFSNFKILNYLRDPEFNFYTKLLLASVLFFILTLWIVGFGDEENIPIIALFQVVSFATTTGFTITDQSSLPLYLPQLLILLGMLGACAGSTAGGFKSIRGLILIQHAKRELKKLVHPNIVLPLKLGKKRISNEVADSVWGFLIVYVLTLIVGIIILMGSGLEAETAISSVASSLNNLGPGLGEVSNNYSIMNDFQKIVLSLIMILGRLEIYTLLVLFTSYFWRE